MAWFIWDGWDCVKLGYGKGSARTTFTSALTALLCACVCVCALQEKEQKYTLRLDEMKVKDVGQGRFGIGKKHAFALFYTTGRSVGS